MPSAIQKKNIGFAFNLQLLRPTIFKNKGGRRNLHLELYLLKQFIAKVQQQYICIYLPFKSDLHSLPSQSSQT